MESEQAKRHHMFPRLPASASKNISGSWLREELEGRASVPEQTMAKPGPDLGPIANSVVQDGR